MVADPSLYGGPVAEIHAQSRDQNITISDGFAKSLEDPAQCAVTNK
jgi:hypothetical protein